MEGKMSNLNYALILHLWFIAWSALCFGHLFGHFGDLSYDRRIMLFKAVVGRWYDRKTSYVESLKKFYAITWPISLVIYLFILWSLGRR
jgi:hypothetical protein